MDTEVRKEEVLAGIKELEDRLTRVWLKAIDDDDFEGAVELLQQWKTRAGQFLRANVSEVEARELQKITRNYPPIRHVGDIDFRIAKYEGILHAIIEEIQEDPTILPAVASPPAPEPAKTQDSGGIDSYRPAVQPDVSYANELYDRVKTLIHDAAPLDVNKARVIVELAEDAVKEFGNTNQEKKVELKSIKEKAEEALPAKTVEELRKRAEGFIIDKAFPLKPRRRALLYVAVGVLIVVAFLAPFIAWLLSNAKPQPKNENSNAVTAVNSTPPANQQKPPHNTDGIQTAPVKPAEPNPQSVSVRAERTGSAFGGDISIGVNGILYDGTPLRHTVNATLRSPEHKSQLVRRFEVNHSVIYKGRAVYEITLKEVDTFSALFEVRKIEK
jgi:hypothetical protein